MELIPLRVTPRAGRDSVAEEIGPDGPRLAVRVTAAPEGGKANRAVVKLVARALGVPPSALGVARGGKGRDKFLRLAESHRG